jgi:hypothetical protein
MATADPAAGLPMLRPPDAMPDGWYDAYCAAARMLNSGRETARVWYGLGLAPEFAGSWAREGISPAEAWRWMDYGCTAEIAASHIATGRTPADMPALYSQLMPPA